jgi:hypothetical protein
LFNLKWSAIAGGTGLAVSLLVGIVSGAGFPMLLIRALILGAVFFVLGSLIWMVINNFIPELISPGAYEEDSGAPRPGSRVDISLGDAQESALPEMFRGSGSGEEVGDIADLLSGKNIPPNNPGMDQNKEEGYTQKGGGEFQSEAGETSAGPDAVSLAGFGGEDVLPDLESMREAFNPSREEPAELEPETAIPERRPAASKNQSLQGDFRPQELAAAIRTKISKE